MPCPEDISSRATSEESTLPSPSSSIANHPITPSASNPDHQPAKKRKVSKGDEVDEAILRSLKDIQERNAQQWQQAETEELFGKQVAAVLRRLTPRQKAIAKLHIQQILTDIEFPDQATSTSMNLSTFSDNSIN